MTDDFMKYPAWLRTQYVGHPQTIECRHCGDLRKFHWENDYCAFAPTRFEQLPIKDAYNKHLAEEARKSAAVKRLESLFVSTPRARDVSKKMA